MSRAKHPCVMTEVLRYDLTNILLGCQAAKNPRCVCFVVFDRGTFWVLPLANFYLPKNARAYLFPQCVKIHYFCSGPISVDPSRPHPTLDRCCVCVSTLWTGSFA